MAVVTTSITFNTHAGYQMLDITGEVAQKIRESGLKAGIATIFVAGSTAGLTTIEYEPGLVQDMERCFEKLAPERAGYEHEKRWHDNNGHAHVRASLLGPSLTVPFANQNMTLGTWQQIVLLDFDVPARRRELVVQIMGE